MAESGPAPESRRERRDREQGRKRLRDRSPFAAFLAECATVVVLAIIISFIVKTFFLRAFFIPSESMEPTLEVDDRIVVNLLVPGLMDIDRGDVVVFEDTREWWGSVEAPETNLFQDAMIFIGLMPDTSSHYVVKRVVGTEGDRVECCDDQGRILVNGEPIDEPICIRRTNQRRGVRGDGPRGLRVASGRSPQCLRRLPGPCLRPRYGSGAGRRRHRTFGGDHLAWENWAGGGSDREPFEHVPERAPEDG